MYIQKIFHLHLSLEASRERVLECGALWELEIERATFTHDRGHFEVETGLGDRLSSDIRKLPGEDPNRILFQSVGGNVELAGMVEFAPIRENLTEVTLTLDYEMVSPIQRAFDALTSNFDRFLNRQLIRLENCLQRPAGSAFHPASNAGAMAA